MAESAVGARFCKPRNLSACVLCVLMRAHDFGFACSDCAVFGAYCVALLVEYLQQCAGADRGASDL